MWKFGCFDVQKEPLLIKMFMLRGGKMRGWAGWGQDGYFIVIRMVGSGWDPQSLLNLFF